MEKEGIKDQSSSKENSTKDGVVSRQFYQQSPTPSEEERRRILVNEAGIVLLDESTSGNANICDNSVPSSSINTSEPILNYDILDFDSDFFNSPEASPKGDNMNGEQPTTPQPPTEPSLGENWMDSVQMDMGAMLNQTSSEEISTEMDDDDEDETAVPDEEAIEDINDEIVPDSSNIGLEEVFPQQQATVSESDVPEVTSQSLVCTQEPLESEHDIDEVPSFDGPEAQMPLQIPLSDIKVKLLTPSTGREETSMDSGTCNLITIQPMFSTPTVIPQEINDMLKPTVLGKRKRKSDDTACSSSSKKPSQNSNVDKSWWREEDKDQYGNIWQLDINNYPDPEHQDRIRAAKRHRSYRESISALYAAIGLKNYRQDRKAILDAPEENRDEMAKKYALTIAYNIYMNLRFSGSADLS